MKKTAFRIGMILLKKSRQCLATRVRQQMLNRRSNIQAGKKHIVDFMIKFEALAVKTKADNMHTIFLLKKNVKSDIIKTILGYSPIIAPEILKDEKCDYLGWIGI